MGGKALCRVPTRACAAARATSHIRMRASISASAVATFGLAIASTAPASKASMNFWEPCSVRVEQMTTGIGRCDIIFLRNVSPSIRGISMSRKITSGKLMRIFCAATYGSEAIPNTSRSGAFSIMLHKALRTAAESSTIRTLIFSPLF